MDQQTRVLNILSGKAQIAMEQLINAIPLSADADICTRLLFDEARHNLIIALRSAQILYASTAPPIRTYTPCPCGCDTREGGAIAPSLPPASGAGTHSL